MIKKHLLGIAIGTTLLLSSQMARAQGLSLNSTGVAADTSAMLDVSSTAKGMLVPRMITTQRNNIHLPANGLLIYQTDGTAGFYYNSGTTTAPVWTPVSGGTPTGAAGGDLTGSTYPNPTVSNNAITSAKILDGTIANADVSATAGITYGKLNLAGSVAIPGDINATGTASATTFLRGDGSWATPAGGGGGFVTGAFASPSQTTPYSIGIITGGKNSDVMPVTCVIDAFYVHVIVVATYDSGGSNTFTGTILKNGLPTSCTVTFTLGTTDADGTVIGTFSNTTNTVSVTAGDLLSVQWTESNPGTSGTTGGELATMNCSFHAH